MMIKKDFRNDLLKRREIKAVIEMDSNPGFEKVKNLIIDKFKVDESVLVMYGIKGSFGSRSFLIEFSIYDSASDKDKVEPKKKEKKTREVKV